MKHNIDSKGRAIRATTGIAVLIAAIVSYLLNAPLWVTVPLVLFGGFMLFQAVSGWCAARACGMKTKF